MILVFNLNLFGSVTLFPLNDCAWDLFSKSCNGLAPYVLGVEDSSSGSFIPLKKLRGVILFSELAYYKANSFIRFCDSLIPLYLPIELVELLMLISLPTLLTQSIGFMMGELFNEGYFF